MAESDFTDFEEENINGERYNQHLPIWQMGN